MLRLLVPYMPGETPTSFCSRLAIRNACRNARDFCQLLGLHFRRIADGDPQALARLADLSGTSPERIADGTIRRLDSVRFSINGETITKPMLRRATIRICPLCLSDDMAAGPDLGKLAAFQRVEWLFSAFRRCPTHGIALVEICKDAHPSRTHDFGEAVLRHVNDPPTWPIEPHDLPQSKFEDYVRARIQGTGGRAAGWLDHLRLYAVVRLCESFGLLSRFGPNARRRDLSEFDMHAACDEGIGVLEGGSKSVAPFLDKLIEPFWSRRYDVGLKSLLGELNDWLSRETDPEYESARQVIREHVLDRLPFDPGDKLMGRAVESRRLWSVYSATRATGLNHKRLRRLLAARGVIHKDQETKSDNRVTFLASEENNTFIAKLKGAMKLIEAREYIGAPRVQMQILIDEGILAPLVHGRRRSDDHNHAFAKEDADAFLAAITADATCTDLSNLVSIPTASRKSMTSTIFVVRLLLDRKLRRVGRDPTKYGYMSVLVDPAEIRSYRIHPATVPDGFLSVHQTMKLTRWPHHVVKSLAANGHLQSRSQGQRHLIDRNSIEAFQIEFVSLVDLASGFGSDALKVKKRLSEAGVAPAFDSITLRKTFYHRKKVEAAIGPLN